MTWFGWLRRKKKDEVKVYGPRIEPTPAPLTYRATMPAQTVVTHQPDNFLPGMMLGAMLSSSHHHHHDSPAPEPERFSGGGGESGGAGASGGWDSSSSSDSGPSSSDGGGSSSSC